MGRSSEQAKVRNDNRRQYPIDRLRILNNVPIERHLRSSKRLHRPRSRRRRPYASDDAFGIAAVDARLLFGTESRYFDRKQTNVSLFQLLSEYDWENEKELDVIMYLGCASAIVGGQTVYIASDERIEDSLVTLETSDNTLNIVFRDSAKVVKHVSNRSQTKCFYVLSCSYKE